MTTPKRKMDSTTAGKGGKGGPPPEWGPECQTCQDDGEVFDPVSGSFHDCPECGPRIDPPDTLASLGVPL